MYFLSFFLYVHLIYITLTDTTNRSVASGFHLFFGGGQHERKGAGDPFKIFRSQATQAKAETWHFF